MGVEKFYIYDNGSTDDTRAVLQPYIESGVVSYFFFPGQKRQLEAYDECLKNFRYRTRWLAFLDLDEFIVPVKDKSITAFLKRFEKFPVVEINWLVYGSNGLKEGADTPVMKRFTRHSLPDHYLNSHVKSIVNPLRVYNMIGCHEAARIDGKAADTHGNPVKISFRDRKPEHDVIRINHYAVKSWQEFKEKQSRGRARCKNKLRPDSYFTEYDLNDIEDTTQYF